MQIAISGACNCKKPSKHNNHRLPSNTLFIHSSFITSTGSHVQIYSEVQLYNKLYLYTIDTDTHIMQEHIKGPYSENYKNIKPIPHKKRNLKKQLLHIFSGYSHFIY